MKTILNNIMITAIICSIFLLAGCPNSAMPKTDIKSNASPNPQIQPGAISEQDIMNAFALVKGEITASDAAKKIRDTAPSAGAGLTFTEKTLTAYDDEAGTFTVKVKGTKGGKSFEKELAFTGFTHPYAGTSLGSVIGSEYLIFDKAIEKNADLDTFIADAKAAKGVGYTSFSYTLNKGGGKNAEFGIHFGYSLTARLIKTADNKIKIMADYTVLYKKLVPEGSETVKTGESYTKPVTENASYFTEKDVLKYVLDKTNENFVQVDANKFASYYYIRSKYSNGSAVGFDMNQIQKYVDLYRTKDEGEYLQINIAAGINNPKGDGLKADDCKGELTVNYCIATADQLTNQSGIKHSKSVTKNGLQKIENAEDALRNHFIFTVDISPNNADNRSKWNTKSLQNVRLFYVNENGTVPVGSVTNPLQNVTTENPYRLTINGNPDDGSSSLGAGNYGLSKDTSNREIYIQNISLNKDSNSNKLKVSMQLCGGKIIEMTTEPFLGHSGR